MRVRLLCNNCYVVDKNEKEEIYYCQSYDFVVAIYNSTKRKLIIGRKWDYSRTTLKHIKIFIEKYVPELNKPTKSNIELWMKTGKIDYSDMLI